MVNPLNWRKPSFSLCEQPHRKLKQAGQLEVKEKQKELKGQLLWNAQYLCALLQQTSSKIMKTFTAT